MKIRLGLGQMDMKLGDTEYNLKQVKHLLGEASRERVDILVFPELVNSGYYFDSLHHAESLSEEIPDGPFSKELIQWSKGGGLVVAGINEISEKGLHNSAVIIGNGCHLGTYRKFHLFGTENKWFLQGQQEPPVFEYNDIHFCVIICYEWNFPERLIKPSSKGAMLVLHPLMSSSYKWREGMRKIAVDNGIYTVSANRIGQEKEYSFSGQSSVLNPEGNVILQMNNDDCKVGHIDIDF